MTHRILCKLRNNRVPSNCFIKRFRTAVSVLVGPCCPALLKCFDVDVHTVVLFDKQNNDDDGYTIQGR